MGLFSHRRGYKSLRTELQLESIDQSLRVRLWNVFEQSFLNQLSSGFIPRWYHYVWDNHFKLKTNTIGMYDDARQKIETYFFTCKWFEVYDFLEFSIASVSYDSLAKLFAQDCNLVLEQELAGYRLISGVFTPITSDSELINVESAVDNSPKNASMHLKQALVHLSDKKSPDYRNSIKESISAVEALSSILAGKPTATLGEAIKEIDKASPIQMHSALSGAFLKLYGWTSDANGIRHALQDEPNLGFEDALFMLVSCSAFINYLIAKATKAGIKL